MSESGPRSGHRRGSACWTMLQTGAQKVPIGATGFEGLRLVPGTCRPSRARLTGAVDRLRRETANVIEQGCNPRSSLKAAECQKSDTSFASRSCMEPGAVGSCRDGNVRTDVLCGLRKG